MTASTPLKGFSSCVVPRTISRTNWAQSSQLGSGSMTALSVTSRPAPPVAEAVSPASSTASRSGSYVEALVETGGVTAFTTNGLRPQQEPPGWRASRIRRTVLQPQDRWRILEVTMSISSVVTVSGSVPR